MHFKKWITVTALSLCAVAAISVNKAHAAPMHGDPAHCEQMGHIAVQGFVLARQGYYPERVFEAFKEEFPDLAPEVYTDVRHALWAGAKAPAEADVQDIGQAEFDYCMAVKA